MRIYDYKEFEATCIVWFCAIGMVLVILFFSIPAKADGTEDKNFYGTEIKSLPNQIPVYVPFDAPAGLWLQQLPRYQLPSGRLMLSPDHRDYWRDFNQFPCHYDLGKPCVEQVSYRDIPATVTATVPEPAPALMLFTGISALVIRRIV
jgi:hypothetical protein